MARFDDWVKRYDETPLERLPWEHGAPKDAVVELVQSGLVMPGERALDIGCGAGSNTAYLASCGFMTVGIDVVPRALAYAREKGGARLVVADAVNMPFKAASFGLAVDYGCFHCLDEGLLAGYAEGLSRVLKHGAIYQLTCFSKRLPPPPVAKGYGESTVRAIFSGSFDIFSVKEFETGALPNEAHSFYTFMMLRK